MGEALEAGDDGDVVCGDEFPELMVSGGEVVAPFGGGVEDGAEEAGGVGGGGAGTVAVEGGE